MANVRRAIALVCILLAVSCSIFLPAADSGSRYSVVITGVDPEWKIRSIKAIRAETGLGLADAKSLIEGVPSIVKVGLTRSEAEAVAARLRAQQMTVELRPES